MSFYQFLVILKARKKIVLFSMLFIVSSVLAVTLMLPKVYESTTSLVVNYNATDPVTGGQLPSQLLPGYMATQVDIIRSKGVALKVVDNLGLYTEPAFIEAFYESTEGEGDIRNWLAQIILKKLEVVPSRQSNVIEIIYEANAPGFSAVMANAFSQAYIEKNVELKIEPSKRTADWFKKQVEEKREELIEAQNRLSSYQREKGIVSIDKRYDVESSRLSQLSQQLVLAQSELYAFESKREAIRASQTSMGESDLISDPIVRDVKNGLSRAETRRDELKQRFNIKHPDYLSAQAEVNSLKRKLTGEIKLAIARIDSDVLITSRRVAEIESAIFKQKEVLLAINQDRNMLDVLQRDVENYEKTLGLTTQRLNQTSLEAQSKESDVSVLSVATPPIDPSKPNVFINILLGFFLGSGLSILLALAFEFISPKIRTSQDIVQKADLPVLGEI